MAAPLLVDDAAEARAGYVARGDRYLVCLQPVQELRPGERRLFLVRVEVYVLGGLRHLGRVGEYVPQN